MTQNLHFLTRVPRLLAAALLALLAITVSPALASEEDDNAAMTDPLEALNRAIFGFNEVVDGVALKPAAQIYRGVVPEYGRERVSNVLVNMERPVVVLNSVLQGDPENAFSAFWSFVLNSTLGVAGVFDFAGAATDLNVREEDFGQTLGVWGFDPGPYIVLPVFGPSSARDTVGLAADVLSDPFNYADDDFVIARTITAAIDKRANNLDLIDEVYETSFDPYATIRSLYLQKRDADVRNNGHNGE